MSGEGTGVEGVAKGEKIPASAGNGNLPHTPYLASRFTPVNNVFHIGY
jgi:hypothetical protein